MTTTTSTSTIKEFCVQNNIRWFPINLSFVPNKDGKMEKVLGEIKNKCYFNPDKRNFKPTQSDFANISSEVIAERQRLFGDSCTHIAMDTREIFHIDIDEPKYNAEFDEIAKTAPYFTSTTKAYGKHILIKNASFIPSKKRHQFINLDENNTDMGGVELLCGQWSYAPANGDMVNGDKPILQMDNLAKQLNGYTKIIKIPKENNIKMTIEKPSVDSTVANHVDAVSLDIQQYNDYAKLITFSKGDYDKWYNYQLASFNIGIPYDVYDNTVNSQGGYDADMNKQVWDRNNPNHASKVGWATLFKMALKEHPDEKKELDKKWRDITKQNRQIEKNNMKLNCDIEKQNKFAESSNNSSTVFARLVVDFEKIHAKIINRSLFVKETTEKTLTLTKQQMITSYENMECGVNLQGIPQLFIKKWLLFNDKIRSYDDMNIYPNPSKCPSNMYNLWRPFAMETVRDQSYTPNPEALSFILNHLKILCNNEQVVTDYIVAWIAQMIQYPDVKSIMPTFIAVEGIGKSTLIILLSKMMGASKILETANPSRDVWGEFNDMMADAFLVHLCEISKKDCVESRGKIKNLITDPSITINKKGVGHYPVVSYHRFIGTTNNEDSIPTEKGDRRNLVIRCSDEKKGDTAYFNQMYEY